MTLTWFTEEPKQPEDGRYRLRAFRQRSACWRFSVEKSRNPRSGRTYFTARCHRLNRLGPVSEWLGEFDEARDARAACEAYHAANLVLELQEPESDTDPLVLEVAA